MKKLLAIFLSIAFTGLVLQSCGAKNSETADSSKTEANEEEMLDQQSESEFPYELVPLRYKVKYNPEFGGEQWVYRYLAVKQDGKFVAFDNDADYSGLINEAQLYSCVEMSCNLSDFSDEEIKTLGHLVQQYLRDKSKIREHELFTYIDKAYYDCSDYFAGAFYMESKKYHRHTYRNVNLSNLGNPIFVFCMTPDQYYTEKGLQTLDGEIVPEDALIFSKY